MLSECLTTGCHVGCSTASSLWGQRSVGRPQKRFIDHIKANLLKCNIKPSDLEALTSDRDIWRTVCNTGLRSFLTGWITASEEQRAARHASQRPVHDVLSATEFVLPNWDYGATCGPMSNLATPSYSATSSSNSTDFSSSSSSTLCNFSYDGFSTCGLLTPAADCQGVCKCRT